jgi:cytochrome c5
LHRCTSLAGAASKKAAGAAAAVAVALIISSASPAVAYNEKLGKEVFEGNCATCHTGGKNVLIPNKTLAKADVEKYLDGGFNLSAILYQVCGRAHFVLRFLLSSCTKVAERRL